ncbi:MAG: cobyric acid synthase [Eubacterium sp.]|nr:cobyric acid synthase [Eubacterium sp.]
MAKAIMVLGTMSNAGKSLIAAGLCRIFHQDGYKVAPFKSQNMALNSYITKEGLEMGRAQVVQAQAAGVEPSVTMNPILLKPTNDTGSQVIVNGKVVGTMNARDYYAKKKEYVPAIMQAYQKLDEEYDIIVLEGAGSPAEINLKDDDIVNMGMAKMAKAPVILVGDIDRGGVFAQLCGTIMLLEKDEQDIVKGLLINKFRGDKTILDPGIEMLENICHKKVVGVAPYMHVDIEEEDSLSDRLTKTQYDEKAMIDIAVIRLPRISNYTDLQVFEGMAGIGVRYVTMPHQLGNPDIIILPGTKNTMGDMKWLRESGMETVIVRAHAGGTTIYGICGGYQMLGEELHDPYGVEDGGDLRGLGLLPAKTTFTKEKVRTRVHGTFQELEGDLTMLSGVTLEGYEIHMGETVCTDEKKARPLVQITDEVTGHTVYDGMATQNVYGSYVHGIFDEGDVATAMVKAVAAKKGIRADDITGVDPHVYKEQQFDLLAEQLRKHIDMDEIYRILNDGI